MTIYINYDLSATITLRQILNEVRAVLVDTDPDNYRWSDEDLIGFLNAGERQIVTLKPNSYTATTTVQLAAGTRQEIPANAIMALGIARNMGSNGTTIGAVPTKIERTALDGMLPGWHTATAAGAVQMFVTDEREQRIYHVFPPQPSPGHYVDLLCSHQPPEFTVANIETATSNLGNIYVNPLIDYILYRAFLVDTSEGSSTKATEHFQLFYQGLGMKATVEKGNKAQPRSGQ